MLRPHTPDTVPVITESSSEKKIRYFLIFIFFVQIMLTPLPFMHAVVDVLEEGMTSNLLTISAVQMVFQTNGFSGNEIFLAIYGGLLIILPMAAFFACIFDKRSRVKYILSAACSVGCAVIITFGIGPSVISIAAVITLIINIVSLFMTMQGVQATTRRMAETKKI